MQANQNKAVFNRKNKRNYGKSWHLATMPLSQLCCPHPGLAEPGSAHTHLTQKVSTAFGEGAAQAGPGAARGSAFIDLQVPRPPPLPARPQEGELHASQALSSKENTSGASSPGGAPHHHPKSQAQSISCRGSSSCPPGHPRHLRAGSLRPVPSAASLIRGASRGSQDAGQGGGGRLGQRVQLGGLALCRGWAARLRLRRLTVLPV